MTLVELEFTMGERLAKARKHADLTQDEMADKLGVSHSTVAKWELDKSQPRNMLHLLKKWAELTGVSELWLLGYGKSKSAGSSTPRNHKGRGGSRPGYSSPGGVEHPGLERAS